LHLVIGVRGQIFYKFSMSLSLLGKVRTSVSLPHH